MPTRKLTDATVKALPTPSAGQVDYFDQVLPAFGVRVSYGGAKTWFLVTRIGGKGKLVRSTLGRYPLVGLADARTAARALMDAAARGIDPRQAKQDEIAENERRAALTFGVASDDFLARYAERKLRPATVRGFKGAFARVAHWREWPLANITRRHVLNEIEEMEDAGKGVMADRVFAYLRKFFNWCVDRDLIAVAPTANVRRSLNSKSRERVLSLDELRRAWAAFDAAGYPFGPVFKLMLLTGQRRGEIAGLEWNELRDWSSDKPLLDLPAARTKNGLAHLVPVVPLAKSLIDACPCLGPHVFTTTGETAVSGFSRAKSNVDAAIVAALRKAFEERGDDPEQARMPDWTLHDLRRSMSTHMNERLGIAPHVVEAVINHISGARSGVAGVYNRALYLDERRDALERWANWVEEKQP